MLSVRWNTAKRFRVGGAFLRRVETLPLSLVLYFSTTARCQSESKSKMHLLYLSKRLNSCPVDATKFCTLYPEHNSHSLVQLLDVSFKAAYKAPAAINDGQYSKAWTYKLNRSIPYLANHLTRFFTFGSCTESNAIFVYLSKYWNALGIVNW